MSENVRISRNQRRALAALLSHKSIIDAAAACNLSDKTMQRYLGDPLFKQALAQTESDLIDQAGRRLLAGQDQALDTLDRMTIQAAKDSDRRLASVAWMDLVLKWRELRNVEQRLSDLEKAVYNGNS